ncbi:MAG: RNA polymerase sigma factor [Acidobacteriota bacterium]|nr:RNA polymerase sigma factor [Acidobacteriota bacterium]
MALVEALRRGDAKAFESLVDSYTATMLKLARSYVQSTHAAEDVVQETWMAVVTGIERFEGRSSLKTWIFRILVNRARSRSRGDRRFDLGPAQTGGDEAPGPSVDQARFETSGRWAGHWAVPPAPLPEDRLLSAELRAVINRLIDRLPPRQRSVLVLRDVEGLSAAEACEVLGLSEANQRVLLHRARVKVRDLLEMILDEEMSA